MLNKTYRFFDVRVAVPVVGDVGDDDYKSISGHIIN